MKCIIFAFLLFLGCSQTTSSSSLPPGPMSAVFQPGGKFYVSPGVFEGTWTIDTINRHNVLVGSEVDSCTASITEADSLLVGKITNNSTNEMLILNGYHTYGTAFLTEPEPHLYEVQNSKIASGLSFYTTGDTLACSGFERIPADSSPIFVITCFRK